MSKKFINCKQDVSCKFYSHYNTFSGEQRHQDFNTNHFIILGRYVDVFVNSLAFHMVMSKLEATASISENNTQRTLTNG